MRTPVKGKVSKIRSIFENPAVDRYKSAMVKPSKKKPAAGGELAAAIKQQLLGGATGRKTTDSTSDQEEGFTTVKSKMKKKFTLPRKQKEAGDEDMQVDKEAGTSGVSKKVAEKRPRDSEDEEGDTTCYEDAEELESSFISDIKQMLEDGGAGHMFAPIRDRFQKFVAKLLKKQATMIKAEMADIRKKEKDLDKCGRSLIIHNADRIAMEDDNDYIRYNLAEQVTETLHTMCRSMICVMEAYTLGKWVDGTPPTSVCVVLGSARQKGVIFRAIAGHIKAKTAIGKALGGVAFRDCFPKELIPDSQRLVQQGKALKNNGQVEVFKVVARGPGVIPVLEVKRKASGGGLTKWEVFKSQMQGGGSKRVVEPEKEKEKEKEKEGRVVDSGLAAAVGQITNFTDSYLGDLDPVLQDDIIRRANGLPSNLIPPK